MATLKAAAARGRQPRVDGGSIPVQQAAYLRTSPTGQVVMDVEKGTKFTAATDVIDVLYGQEAGEAFIYDRGRFRRIVSGD